MHRRFTQNAVAVFALLTGEDVSILLCADEARPVALRARAAVVLFVTLTASPRGFVQPATTAQYSIVSGSLGLLTRRTSSSGQSS